MPTSSDPHAVNPVQHAPRVPGERIDEVVKGDHPKKPFRTPNKNGTHPAPERATDGEPIARGVKR